MLIEFWLDNFRSFLNRQVFTFVNSPDRAHEGRHSVRTTIKSAPRLLKVAIIFGPNASGKSNLLEALAIFRSLVLSSNGLTGADWAALYQPFCFGKADSLPTEFCVDVLIDKVRYRYHVSYDAVRVRAESLHVYRTGKSQRWFDRSFDDQSQQEVWQPFSPHFNGPREVWRKATRPTALFLTVASQLNAAQLSPLFHWFEHCLEVVAVSDSAETKQAAARIADPKLKARIMTVLQAVGMNVDDVRVPNQEQAGRVALAGKPVFEAGRKTGQIEFLHAAPHCAPIWLRAELEAIGTHRLFALAGRLLQAIDDGKLLLIDQFDSGLHPLIARYLVRQMIDARVASCKTQLLLTSYNTTLMDLQMLRRDEIWLMNLDSNNASVLVPITAKHPRKHEKIAKAYLNGRYAAVPQIEPEEHML